jgi:hypothetical protein
MDTEAVGFALIADGVCLQRFGIFVAARPWPATSLRMISKALQKDRRERGDLANGPAL